MSSEGSEAQAGGAHWAQSRTAFGAKIALICGDQLVTYLRDDFAHIPDPGVWDLPGGVREAGETALDCVLRETREEFGIQIPAEAVVFADRFYKYQPERIEGVFFVAEITPALVETIAFGEEGQCWEMMPVTGFLAHRMAVPELQAMLAVWWQGPG